MSERYCETCENFEHSKYNKFPGYCHFWHAFYYNGTPCCGFYKFGECTIIKESEVYFCEDCEHFSNNSNTFGYCILWGEDTHAYNPSCKEFLIK